MKLPTNIGQKIFPFKDVWSGDDYLGLMIGDRCGDRSPKTVLIAGQRKKNQFKASQKRSMSMSMNGLRSQLDPVSRYWENKWCSLTFALGNSAVCWAWDMWLGQMVAQNIRCGMGALVKFCNSLEYHLVIYTVVDWRPGCREIIKLDRTVAHWTHVNMSGRAGTRSRRRWFSLAIPMHTVYQWQRDLARFFAALYQWHFLISPNYIPWATHVLYAQNLGASS